VDHFIFRWEQSLKLCSDWVSKFKVLSNVSDLLFHLTGKNAEKIIIFTDFIKTVIISSTCRPLFVCFQSVAVIDYTAIYYSYNVIHDVFVFFTFAQSTHLSWLRHRMRDLSLWREVQLLCLLGERRTNYLIRWMHAGQPINYPINNILTGSEGDSRVDYSQALPCI